MRYFNKLEGDKIYLSPVNVDDAEIYTKWVNDLSTSSLLGTSSTVYSLLAEKEILEGLAKYGHNFAIILKDEDKLLGNCSLFDVKQIHRTCELGIFIGEEEYRSKGYGSEAVELLLCYGFKILNLNNIMLRVFSFNLRGIKAYERIGFKEFGRRTNAYYINGKYYDEVFMEVLAKDFQSEYLDEKLPK
jgi:RimJ/RimL family protein N-acetyltransferase